MFRKNVSGQFIHFQGVDATTGGIKSGVTWTVRRCIDGTFAAATGTATEDGTTGWYKFAMSQADTNGNNIGFNFTGTGAVPQTVNIVTTDANPYDAVRLGLTALPNAAAEAAGGLYTRGTGAGQIAQPANGSIDARLADAVSHGGTLGSSTATLALSRLSVVSQSANTTALTITGNGTGHGAVLTSGAGATGDGVQITAGSTNGNGLKLTKTGTGVALAAPTTDIVLAKTTNITGLNDIAATAVVSAGAITTSSGAVATVNSIATGGITSASFAAGAIDNAAFNVTETLTANPATGGIASTSFAAGAIDAAAIAADAITSSELAQSAAQEIADEVLDRNLAGGGSGNTRNVRNALRALRNKVSESGGTLTVTQEDDIAAAWTAAVTRTASTDPITSVDPA